MQDVVEKLLRSDTRFVAEDGVLLKNKVHEAALQYDAGLIRALLGNAKTKQHFFLDVDGALIFHVDKFVQFVTSKAWLPDSYTAFGNKVGLQVGDEYLSQKRDVALVWPYKDCVLEGGMEKEDEKRDEIFYNETLASDEITRLLEPKVFTGWNRYTKDGEKKVGELKRDESGMIRENLIIRGNNLLALHSLKEEFAGKVKLIYIDPPYNRDAEAFYNDSFHTSSWLTFMMNRLAIAWHLLRPDGFLMIQIDDAQQAHLRILCDDLFPQRFVNCVVVKSSETSGPKMAHIEKRLPKLKDYLLVYRKSDAGVLRPIEAAKDFINKDLAYLKYYSKIITNPSAPVEHWIIQSISDYCQNNGINAQDAQGLVDFKLENAERVVYRTNNKSFDQLEFPTKTAEVTSATGLKYVWWEGKQMLFLKDYLREHLGDLWTDISTINLNKEGGVQLPAGKKPEELLQRLLDVVTTRGDIVLDYHLGSGTTAAVAHKMGRQYIGLEQLDYGDNDATVRLQNVIKGDASGISKAVGWKGGWDFVYAELMKNNEALVERIEATKTTKALWTIWEELKKSGLLSYKVKPEAVDANKKTFEELSLAQQKDFLMRCVNKNHLYVNLGDMDDKTYKVSEEDKRLTRAFYNGGHA